MNLTNFVVGTSGEVILSVSGVLIHDGLLMYLYYSTTVPILQHKKRNFVIHDGVSVTYLEIVTIYIPSLVKQ
jgi:hypothetical protein